MSHGPAVSGGGGGWWRLRRWSGGTSIMYALHVPEASVLIFTLKMLTLNFRPNHKDVDANFFVNCKPCHVGIY